MAGQLWFMTRIREEEEEWTGIHIRLFEVRRMYKHIYLGVWRTVSPQRGAAHCPTIIRIHVDIVIIIHIRL